MNKMLNSYGARVLAFLLCCAFGLVTVGCIAGFAYVSYEPGMGRTDERDFLNSELGRSYARTEAWKVVDSAVTYYYNDYGYHYYENGFEEAELTPQPTPMPAAEPGSDLTQEAAASAAEHPAPMLDPDRLYLPDPEDGFSCVVRDPDGKIIADTRLDSSLPVEGNTVEVFEYVVEPYINLPVKENTELYGYLTVYDTIYNLRTLFLPIGLASGLLTILLFVFLMAAAGRTPEGVRLGGLHRLPLEIYLGALTGTAILCLYLIFNVSYHETLRHILLFCVLDSLAILAAGGCALLGCMTLAARFRAGRWWRNSVTFFCLRWCWVLILWSWKWIWKVLVFCWRLVRSLFRGCGALIRSLPLTWKSAAAYCGFILMNIVLTMAIWNGVGWFILLLLLDAAGLAAVVWTAMQLRKLQAAGRALAAGDLSAAVDTKHMLPVLREHAENLGAVSLGMTRAVNERMKSERFKTELITNVSHDLKTPLTSIVSYVDLLKNEQIDNERAREYIDVLDRQSQRLKKLTTDLVDASKASSGVLTVNPEQVDLGELLRQSAGEYAERFAAARLTPVLNVPEESTVVTADGRLLWRVLDNLLTNVVKYALPGTRVYMDITSQEGRTAVSVKNISREPLNIPADELMERFVRGDASRSTDGSGLGLSIARSLMELMGGQLRLTLDGDLFKADLIFGQKLT